MAAFGIPYLHIRFTTNLRTYITPSPRIFHYRASIDLLKDKQDFYNYWHCSKFHQCAIFKRFVFSATYLVKISKDSNDCKGENKTQHSQGTRDACVQCFGDFYFIAL